MEDLGIGARVIHPRFGEGIVAGISVSTYTIFFKQIGDKEIARTFDGLEVIEETAQVDQGLSLEEVKNALKKVLDEYSGITQVVELAPKWKGGTLLFQPGDPGLKAKEIPIDTFWHKIVMLRDRIRVMEQQINAHKVLTEDDKVNLQQYITRMYGSLTTFNVLFRDKNDQFKGESQR